MESYEAVNNLITYTSKLFTVTYPDDGMNFIASSFAAKVDYKGGATVIDADWDNDGKIDISNTIFSENRIFFSRNTTTGFNLTFTNFLIFLEVLLTALDWPKQILMETEN